jgi:hypothetical protein
MGIYVTKASALKELLEQHMPDANDFGNEVIPGARKMGYPVQVSPSPNKCRTVTQPGRQNNSRQTGAGHDEAQHVRIFFGCRASIQCWLSVGS